MRQICRGEVLTAEKCADYRRLWDDMAKGMTPEQSGAMSLKPEFATPEKFPCPFRGDSDGEIPCLVCGQKGMLATKYKCEKHGACTVGQHGATVDGLQAGEKIKVCLGCEFLPDT